MRWICVLVLAVLAGRGVSYDCGHLARGKHLGKAVKIRVCNREDDFPCVCFKSSINCNGEQLPSANVELVQELESAGRAVKSLSMQGNRLEALYKDRIIPGHRKTLVRLDLSRNQICYIQDSAFEGMDKLQHLDLSFNKIHKLTVEKFGFAFNLKELSLQNNQIENLTGPVFEEVNHLKYLYLDNNPIKNMDKDTFSGLNELVELTLDNTALSYIGDDWFASLSNLKTLSLRHNRFVSVPPLSHLSSLRRLDISYNPILNLQRHAFQGLSRLQELTISYMMKMWVVEDCAFCGLNRLHILKMYNCSELMSIDPEAFGQKHNFAQRTKNVDLEFNALSHLSGSLLPWENVTTVKLGNNPWHCDCSIAWMTGLPPKQFQGTIPRCLSPKHLQGRQVLSLERTELCMEVMAQRNAGPGRIFICITVVLAVGALLSLVWYKWMNRVRHSPNHRNIFHRLQMPNLAMDSKMEKPLGLDAQKDPTPVQL